MSGHFARLSIKNATMNTLKIKLFLWSSIFFYPPSSFSWNPKVVDQCLVNKGRCSGFACLVSAPSGAFNQVTCWEPSDCTLHFSLFDHFVHTRRKNANICLLTILKWFEICSIKIDNIISLKCPVTLLFYEKWNDE